MARIRIGTSGWHYDSWRGPFFPDRLLTKHQLRYYATQFETVELNGVFYRTPSTQTVTSWREQTGPDFVFSWKASRFITHWKRLSETSIDGLKLLEQRLSPLDEKVGPILFQLPPTMRADLERLARFIRLLSRKRRYTFEFRHPGWYAQPILRLLSDHNIALCISDHYDAPAPWECTADFVYVRGHGPEGKYKGRYPTPVLRELTVNSVKWRRRGFDVFIYFDNDQESAAPADAIKLKQQIWLAD